MPIHGEAGHLPAAVALVARRAEGVSLVEGAAELIEVQRLRRGCLEGLSVALQALGREPVAERLCDVGGPLRASPVRRQDLRGCNTIWGLPLACRVAQCKSMTVIREHGGGGEGGRSPPTWVHSSFG